VEQVFDDHPYQVMTDDRPSISSPTTADCYFGVPVELCPEKGEEH